MNFTDNKYSSFHVGRHNTGNGYNLNRVYIGKSYSEKDLGVLVNQVLRLKG